MRLDPCKHPASDLDFFQNKKKSSLYRVTIGLIIKYVLWIFLTLPKLFFKLCKPHRFTAKTTTKKSGNLSELSQELAGKAFLEPKRSRVLPAKPPALSDQSPQSTLPPSRRRVPACWS